MSIRCLLGHRWVLVGIRDICRIVDNRAVGSELLVQCSECGKLKKVKP